MSRGKLKSSNVFFPKEEREKKQGIITYSMFRTFLDCRRKCKLRYIERLRPVNQSSVQALVFGSVVHDCLEIWHATQDEKRVFNVIEKSDCLDEIEKSKAMAMMQGYFYRYPDEIFNNVFLEKEFVFPILHPQSNRPAEKLVMAGKIDGIVELDGKFFILEHKTTYKISKSYLEKIPYDNQILLYAFFAENIVGKPIHGVIYNILQKSNLAFKQEESIVSFDIRRKQLIQKSKTGKTSAKRQIGETKENYYDRLVEKHKERHMYQRVFVELTPDKIEYIQNLLWKITDEIANTDEDGFYPNTSRCFDFGRQCDYFPLCQPNNKINELLKQNLFKKVAAHTELSKKTIGKYSNLGNIFFKKKEKCK